MDNIYNKKAELCYDKFPEGFMWSAATAAHQIEGAAREDGKGESIWNEFEKVKGNIANESTGDIACDSYHLYQQDISILKEIGLSYYRFSISWPRILPKGNDSSINLKGIEYYNKLIDSLLKENICPVVTLYHWDLPQALQEEGGWANNQIIDHFNSYARICYQTFGDRVKYWITINEPICVAWLGNGLGMHAPGVKDPMNTAFKVAHHLILAHVKAWRTYDREFRTEQHGKVGISLNSEWGEPTSMLDPEDIDASEHFMLFKLGWFADPIFRHGDYPDILKAQFHQISSMLGNPPMPKFSDEEIKQNRGSFDFFGLNHYTSRLVKKLSGEPVSEEEAFINIKESTDPSWRQAASPWLFEAAFGMRRILNWIKYRYANPKIFITENGTSDAKGDLDDRFRAEYHRQYISQVARAIHEDDVDVIGYTAWSLLDNFEWERGYLERFGLYAVDFESPQRTRTAKASARAYAEIVANNGLVGGRKVGGSSPALVSEEELVVKAKEFFEDENIFKYKL